MLIFGYGLQCIKKSNMIEGDWLSNGAMHCVAPLPGLCLLLGYGIITPHTEIRVYVRTCHN